MQEKRKHEDLNKNITLAVKEGRDNLAEAGIAQQMDIEAQIPVLEHAIADPAEQGKELEAYITALQAKKRERIIDIVTSQHTESGIIGTSSLGGVVVRAERGPLNFKEN